ncbi:MAG: hypothetical protein Q8S84_05215 [bacterium]|nr:hypothetical protein [bacterium]
MSIQSIFIFSIWSSRYLAKAHHPNHIISIFLGIFFMNHPSKHLFI